ncbi:hypothetical protein HPB50_028522 [Hyalomma asiaticum]|nr:hypothetical protein HPB50_028522 [Hyalomma asiaticum]
MPTGAVHRRSRKRKSKAKATPSASRGGAPASSPSDVDDLKEMVARLEVQEGGEQKSQKEKSRAESSRTTYPKDNKEQKGSTKEGSMHEASFNSEGRATGSEKAQPQPINNLGSAGNVRRQRALQPMKNPSSPVQNPSHSRHASQVYQEHWLVSMIRRHPDFQLVHQDEHRVVYHRVKDGERRECGGSSNTQAEETVVQRSSGSGENVRQHAVPGDDEAQRDRISSSSSSDYESAVEEQPDEETPGLKDASSQEPSPSRSHFHSPQGKQDTSDAEVQTGGLDLSLAQEIRSTLQCRDAEVAQLKGPLNNVQESQVDETQRYSSKIELTKEPQPDPPRKLAELKRCTSKENQEPAIENRAGEALIPQPLQLQSRQPMQERNLLPVVEPENKTLTFPVDRRPSPQLLAKREPSTVATPPAVLEEHELPGDTTDSCTDVKPAGNSQEYASAYSSKGKQISKLVHMAMKQRPDLSEEEIRSGLQHLRLTLGGLSGMTFSAIVELLLGQLSAGPADKKGM